MEKPWMGTTNAPSVFYGPLFLSIGPPQLFPGTFICQGELSAQLLALTCPSLNSATGPHIPQRSRIHSMRAQANPLRVMNADTHRDLCDFKDQLLREDLALSLDHSRCNPTKRRTRQPCEGWGMQSPLAQATGARFGCYLVLAGS